MSAVPVWMAVAGAGVGLMLGSLNLVEKVVGFFSTEKVSFTERYLIVEVPYINDRGNASEKILEELQDVGSFRVHAVNDFPKLLEYETLIDLEENYCSEKISESGDSCSIVDVSAAFYGISNAGDIPILEQSITLSKFENGERFHENQDQGSILGELDDEDDPACFWTIVNALSDSGCYSRLTGSVEYTSKVPIGRNETLLIPIYFGYTFCVYKITEDKNSCESFFESWFLLPNRVTLNEELVFEAREMDTAPTIRGTYVAERG